MTKKIINEGGKIGSEVNPFNSHSEDFYAVRELIVKYSKKQTPKQVRENIILGFRFQMENYLEEKSPDELISSGNFIKRLLHELNIQHRKFAKYINISETNLSSILSGKRPTNEELALKLEYLFKIDFDLWLKIDYKNHFLKIKQNKSKKYINLNLDELVSI